jgi:hypothetical protein
MMTTPPQSPVSLQHLLLLCLPALIIGIILRISFLVAIPEAHYGSDSNSYFDAAWQLWTHGEISLNAKRRYLYPIVLMFIPPLPGSTAIGTAILQHSLGVAIIIGIGWIVAQLTRFPGVWVPPVTCVAAIWPRMLWYEHEMIAEVLLLAAFVAAVALALPCGALKSKGRLFCFLVAACAIVASKPAGRPLWLGLIIVAVIMAGNPLKWEKKSLAMLLLAVLVIATSGSGRQGSWLLLSSTLPFVQTQGEPYSFYRASLRPLVEQAQGDLENYAKRQRDYKKAVNGTISSRSQIVPNDAWIELGKKKKNQALYQKIAQRLALEAIAAHPVRYSRLVVEKIAFAGSRMFPGLISPANFWTDQVSKNVERMRNPRNQIELVYGVDGYAFLRLAKERRQRTTWFAPALKKLSSMLTWTKYSSVAPAESPQIKYTLLGWLLLLGLVASLAPRLLVCRALLWLPVTLYLFVTFGVGDALSRYLHPVDWVGLVLIAIGLDTMLSLTIDGIARLRGNANEPKNFARSG